jgi:hypothetical protein
MRKQENGKTNTRRRQVRKTAYKALLGYAMKVKMKGK